MRSPPNILEGKAHRNSSEISPEKSYLGNLSTQSGVKKEVKNLDRDRQKHNTGKNRAQGILWGGSGSAEHVTPTNI